MKRFVSYLLYGLVLCTVQLSKAQTVDTLSQTSAPAPRRLTIGGYGGAVASRMLYSNNFKRYTDVAPYKDACSFGQVDLPHVVFFVGYDFGHGWSLDSEIEFEHGGTESAVEIEEEETDEYESEIKRGGEVTLEQFWPQRSFSSVLNPRIGHMVVPVGATNASHMPTEFFMVYRPEGENTILPCTWHETGIGLWDRLPNWRYEVMGIVGLDADRSNNKDWIHGGSGSPYESKMATNYACAMCMDNYLVRNLRLSLSGYVGTSDRNTLSATNKYDHIKGSVCIGAFDFQYANPYLILRGSVDYGHLGDSVEITKANRTTRKDSPSPKNSVAKAALAVGLKGGYDPFSAPAKFRQLKQHLYLFGRYDYYDSMFQIVSNMTDELEWERQKFTVGLNYYPIPDIVVEAEYNHRMLHKQFNDKPTINLGIAYFGMFHF